MIIHVVVASSAESAHEAAPANGRATYHIFEGLTLKPGTSPEAVAALVTNLRELLAGIPAIASAVVGPAHPAHDDEHTIDIAIHMTFRTEEDRNTFYFHENGRVMFTDWIMPNIAGTPFRVEYHGDRTALETHPIPMPAAPWMKGEEGFGAPE
ncbi:Dabb family protein [Streptomyces coeruleorubidus]|uniref:Dabb family protein n=1 Tax=Streptomyces coeruleorubidus TaxID=116188 RepID=UPI0037B9D626